MKFLLLTLGMFALQASQPSAQVNAPMDSSNQSPLFETAPQMISKPDLKFPELAVEAGLAGTIYVKIAINKDGEPFKTAIIKRDPEFVYLFDEAARKFAMQCKFSPARDHEGHPVAVWVTVPLRFKLRDFEPPVCVEQAEPQYPKEALEMGMEGWAAVAVLVDELGTVIKGKVLVVAREPAYTTVFDDAAIAAARNSKYQAALDRNKKTKGWLFMKVSFNIPSKQP